MAKPYLYSRRKVRCKGKKDGRNWYWKFWPLQKGQKESTPVLNQTDPAAYESELVALGDSLITRLSRAWEEIDLKLFPEYCRKMAYRDNLKKKSTQESKEAEEAKKPMLKAKNELDKFESPALSHFWERLLILLFFIIEIPFNSVVFSIFGVPKADTYLMAGGTALVISVLAYFFGKKLKMHPKTLIDKIVLVVLPVLAIAVLTAVSILRSVLFGTVQENNILKINLDPNTAAIIFVSINMALFFAASMVTYAATRPDQKKYKTRLKQFKDAKAAYKKALRDSEDALEELADAEEELAEAHNKRAKTFAIYCEEAANIADDVEWLAGVYRAANTEARLDGKIPECFKKPVAKPHIPDNLKEETISWNCKDVSKNDN